jgi:hypothetical protein
VKTLGHNDWYGQLGALKPVERRDAKIPGDYVKLARATDEKHCGTQTGSDGHVPRRLRALAPTHGIAVGANGEWSRGASTFISDAAWVASANSERFGCCHGQEQAQGSLLRWSESALEGPLFEEPRRSA